VTSTVTSGTSAHPGPAQILGGNSIRDAPEDTMHDTLLAPSRSAAGRRRLAFAGAYLEMLVAMGVGMVALAPVWQWAWPAYADRPDTAALSMATDMTVAVVAWMVVRRHSARIIVAMSVAMCAPFAVLAVPYWAGIMPGAWLLPLGHVVMLPLMAVAMLLPPGHHAPGSGVHSGHPQH
jgi:flagellar biosynthetic protein FliP